MLGAPHSLPPSLPSSLCLSLSFAPSLTHSLLTHPLTPYLPPFVFRLPTHSFTHGLSRSLHNFLLPFLISSLPSPLTHSFTHSPTYSLTDISITYFIVFSRAAFLPHFLVSSFFLLSPSHPPSSSVSLHLCIQSLRIISPSLQHHLSSTLSPLLSIFFSLPFLTNPSSLTLCSTFPSLLTQITSTRSGLYLLSRCHISLNPPSIHSALSFPLHSIKSPPLALDALLFTCTQ